MTLSSVTEMKVTEARIPMDWFLNSKLGRKIVVMEGMLENQASYPVSKIRFQATMHDRQGILVETAESYAGIIIGKEKLKIMGADEIRADFKNAGAAEFQVPPKGKKPYMIVFTSMPDRFRYSIKPVDLERH